MPTVLKKLRCSFARHDERLREELANAVLIRQSHFFVSVSHTQSRKILMSDFRYAESKRGYTDIFFDELTNAGHHFAQPQVAAA